MRRGKPLFPLLSWWKAYHVLNFLIKLLPYFGFVLDVLAQGVKRIVPLLPMVVLFVALAGATLAQTRDPALEARRAQELVTAGRLDEALAIYRGLVQASPGIPALLLNLSITEYKAAQYAQAVLHASAALQLQADLVPARLFLGASQLKLGEFAKAVEALELVVTANPGERNARLMLGEALLGAGKPDEAVTHLEAAAELLPGNARVWYGLGRGYAALGRRQAASEAWDQLLALPPSFESHLHAAQIYDAAQRWREAAVEWRAALAIAPEDRVARMGLGWALFLSHDYDAALATLNPLLANQQADVPFLYGASLLNLQQPGAAIPYLRTAIVREAGLLPARAALGQALLQTGKAEEAIPLLRDALAVDGDGNTHFQLFRAYQLTHREAEAHDALAAYQRIRASLANSAP